MQVEQAKSLHDEEEIERAKKRLITMQKRGKNDGPGASQQNEADGTGTTKQNVPPGGQTRTSVVNDLMCFTNTVSFADIVFHLPELEDLDDHGTKASTIMPDLMEEDE